MCESTNYFWIRVFEYVHERDSAFENLSFGKGVLLDEFYLKDVEGGREDVKNIVRGKYTGNSSEKLSFAKPKKKDGIYAIVLDSDKYFYDRFTLTIDTFCFNCHKPIKGKASEFFKVRCSDEKEHFCCSSDCRIDINRRTDPHNEGEFQYKEAGYCGNVFGYIYLIYNRAEDIYYIGQTRFMPFFRWQEHVKAGAKGDIKDLTFSVLTELPVNRTLSEDDNQSYLNNVEAWWIGKYKEDGYNVFNITNPKLTIAHFKERFDEMVRNIQQFKLQI